MQQACARVDLAAVAVVALARGDVSCAYGSQHVLMSSDEGNMCDFFVCVPPLTVEMCDKHSTGCELSGTLHS